MRITNFLLVHLQNDHFKPVTLSTQVPVTTPQKPVQPSESVYKVLSEPRGRVLILNYEEFENINNNRKGTDEDRRMLKNLFTEVSHDLRGLYYGNLDRPAY